MPKNNNLEPVKLPMALRFGEKPKTNFKNNLESINITLKSGPSMDELRGYLGGFIEATWAEDPTAYGELSAEQTDAIIREALMGKALPTALETVNLVFLIEGISLQEVTHILRYRTASFSADCSGDKWWSHKDALVPNSIQNSNGISIDDPGNFHLRYKHIVQEAKALYCDMIDSKKISIMDARYILPRCLETFYWMRISLKDAIHFIKQRIDKQIQPETDNIMAYQMYCELLKKYPIMHDIIDIHSPSQFYINMARTGKATNLYFPDEDSDKFEWNENDFIYQCYRNEMNGTDIGAQNLFDKKMKEYDQPIEDLKGESTIRLYYDHHIKDQKGRE